MNFSTAIAKISVCCLMMTSCSPQSLEDFQEEGEGVIRSIISQLQLIHNRKDLVQAKPRLVKLFNELTDIMIAAREFHDKHPRIEKLELFARHHELSDQLRIEFNRICQIDGGKEVLEGCQEQSLNRLDAFEYRLRKHKKG
jgi:hypothetical protein